MNNIFEILLNRYEIFLLVLIRTSGIFLISPLFSSQNIPNIMKIGFSFTLSILLMSALGLNAVNVDLDTAFIVILIKELMVGLILGFISYAFFSTFYVTGQIIDMKIGFGMVNVMDPQHRIQIPIMGNFYYILAFLFLLSINGHHTIIKALVDSYEFVPIGNFVFEQDKGLLVTNIISKSFVTGFKLSIPIVATIFLTDLLLGILARAIPQMNVFVVGMPLKILIGLMLIGLSLPILYSLSTGVFNEIVKELYSFLKSFIES